MTLVEVIQGTHVGLKLIQARLVLILALLLTAGFTAWAMWLQTQLGAVIAGGFAVLVFLPVLFRGEMRHGIQTQHQQARDESSWSAARPDARAA
jgi:hypothetical protein